jgi:hypothetical protein
MFAVKLPKSLILGNLLGEGRSPSKGVDRCLAISVSQSASPV